LTCTSPITTLPLPRPRDKCRTEWRTTLARSSVSHRASLSLHDKPIALNVRWWRRPLFCDVKRCQCGSAETSSLCWRSVRDHERTMAWRSDLGMRWRTPFAPAHRRSCVAGDCS
jgi:hypothetical protein